MHSRGANLRYLGLLRTHVRDPEVRNTILVEMVARVVKTELREKLVSILDCISGCFDLFPLVSTRFALVLHFVSTHFHSFRASFRSAKRWRRACCRWRTRVVRR